MTSSYFFENYRNNFNEKDRKVISDNCDKVIKLLQNYAQEN